MIRRPKDRSHERPEMLPFEALHYTIDAHLVNLLTWAHRSAGMCAGMRFSHYGHKRMEAEANRRRIVSMVMRAGRGSVTLEDVSRVLAGDLVAPRRRLVEDAIRRAAVLCEAARQFGRPSDLATAEMFITYLDFLKRGTTLWAHFAGRSADPRSACSRCITDPSTCPPRSRSSSNPPISRSLRPRRRQQRKGVRRPRSALQPLLAGGQCRHHH